MSTDGRIGLQSRAGSAGDQASPWPKPPGGQAGAVDLPTRDDPTQPSTVSPAPTTAGGTYNGRPTPGVSGWAGLDFAAYGRANATPNALIGLHYLRRFVSTGAAVLAEMIQPKPTPTPGTLNSVQDEGAPVSPIPVFRRFVVETLCEPWGWGRIYNDNLPPPDIQKPVAVRKMLAGRALPRMNDPYQPKLTRLSTAPASSAPADTVLGPGATAPNPYAAGVTPIYGGR